MSSILQNPYPSLEAIIATALQTADLVMDMRDAGLQDIQQKANAIDIVTEADVAAENLIRKNLTAINSELGFWGEESNHQPDETAFWVVDPIDGTNNFAMGLPFFAVNIALHDGPQTLLGVTVELPSRRVFWSVIGEGAHLRDPDGTEVKLLVSPATRLQDIFLTTGFPYHRTEHPDNNNLEHDYFVTHAQGVRCLGASALDLAYVAQGALGGYWEGWLKPWDAAAGSLHVREAGGIVTTYNGEPWTLTDHCLVASNGQPEVHQAILDGIREARNALTESLL